MIRKVRHSARALAMDRAIHCPKYVAVLHIQELKMSFITLLLTLAGGGAVVGAVIVGQPTVLFGLFAVAGAIFAFFTMRQAKKAEDAWLPSYED